MLLVTMRQARVMDEGEENHYCMAVLLHSTLTLMHMHRKCLGLRIFDTKMICIHITHGANEG